jgi:hypothetical protein
MSDLLRRRLRALGWLVVGAVWPWACGPSARAEDDLAIEDQRAVATPAQQQVVRMDLGSQFEHHVGRDLLGDPMAAGGGPRPPGGQSSLPAILAGLHGIGELRLARIDAVCSLSPSQRRRLQLAVESDVQRLVSEIEAVQAKYAGRSVEIDRLNPASQRPMQECQQDVQRLAEQRRALLGGDSLLAKALPNTLDMDQLARLAADTAARRGRRWQAIVASLLDGLDAWLGLDQRQYDEIERLLLEKQPPLRVDVAISCNRARQQQAEQILAMLVLAEIDAQRLQATLSERQWKTFSPWREQGEARRSYVVGLGILEQVPE